MERSLHRTAFDRPGAAAIETVTGNIDIERTQINDDEVQNGMKSRLEIISFIGAPHQRFEPFEPRQNKAIEFEHVCGSDSVTVGFEIIQIAQHIPASVANF